MINPPLLSIRREVANATLAYLNDKTIDLEYFFKYESLLRRDLILEELVDVAGDIEDYLSEGTKFADHVGAEAWLRAVIDTVLTKSIEVQNSFIEQNGSWYVQVKRSVEE